MAEQEVLTEAELRGGLARLQSLEKISEQLAAAVRVITMTEGTRAYLEAHDLRALLQLNRALGAYANNVPDPAYSGAPKEPPRWVESVGNFNTMPEPWRDATMEELVALASIKGCPKAEYRQIRLEAEKCWLTGHLFWFYSTAFGIFSDGKLASGMPHRLAGPPRVVQIGCRHDWQELTQAQCRERGISHFGSCWHQLECDRCGHRESYDSSG